MLQDRTDERLALSAANGDREAFGELLERHYGLILSLGQRLLGSRAEAEDLAQDVCVGLARKIRQFRGEARFTTWLYRVALNAGRDALRRRATRGAAHQGFAEVDQMRRAGDAARAAEAEWLRGALAGLKDDLRETAILVLDMEMTHADAGAVLGISENTVSWRLHEVRKALRARAGEDLAT
ncbi:MAG TPA: sigma-70 family RNA polymerase sigma factor [Thermohalobaculum sp.]|nr:sigma-70 family RNA polymerase sigma factor [Thermohalobaculum sp.]